jgi:hypothetical protein
MHRLTAARPLALVAAALACVMTALAGLSPTPPPVLPASLGPVTYLTGSGP